MKWPFVLRSTMDAALRKKDDQQFQAMCRHEREIESLQRDIDKIIRPIAKQIEVARIGKSHSDGVYNIHLRVGSHLLDAARRLPSEAMRSIGQDIAARIVFQIEQKAYEPYKTVAPFDPHARVLPEDPFDPVDGGRK